MDELKKFERLSEPEKIKIMKFYQLFSSGNLDVQLDTEVESIPVKHVGKQKTLDGWLLKSKGTSDLNSNLDVENSGKKLANIENTQSKNISENENKSQDAVKGSDIEVSESQSEKTLHDTSKETSDNVSNVSVTNPEDKPTTVENFETKCAAEKNFRILRYSSSQPKIENSHFGKKNPFVLIEKLDSILNPKIMNSSKTCPSDLDKILHLNDNSSQHVTFPQLITKSQEMPMQTSSDEEVIDVPEISALAVSPLGSSCKEKPREAYYKLKNLCSDHELDLDEIFRAQEFKEMIEKYKSLPGGIVFIGSHKCSATGKVQPTVNFHKSKNILLEVLSALKTRNSSVFPTIE